MKIRLSLCLATLCSGLLTARGQLPAAATRSHSLSVEVATTSAGGKTSTSFAKPYATRTPANGGGSGTLSSKQTKSNQTQVTKESESLQITVHNFGPTPDTALVEWYFVAKPIQPDAVTPLAKQESIFDNGAQSVTIAGGSTQEITAESTEITSKINRSDKQKFKKTGLGKGKAAPVKETGSVMDGWMVRVVADGKVIDARGSSDALTEVAKDDAQFSVLKEQ